MNWATTWRHTVSQTRSMENPHSITLPMHIAKQQPSHRAENVAKTFPNATGEYHSVCFAKMKQKSAENIPVVCTNGVFGFVAQCVCNFVSKRVPGSVARVCVFVSRNVPVSPRNAFAVSSRNVFPVCICGFVLERVWWIRGVVLKRVSRLSFSSWKMFPN